MNQNKVDLIAMVIMILMIVALAWVGGHHIAKAGRLQDEIDALEQNQTVTLMELVSRMTLVELSIAMQPVRRVVLIDVEDYLKEGAE